MQSLPAPSPENQLVSLKQMDDEANSASKASCCYSKESAFVQCRAGTLSSRVVCVGSFFVYLQL